jgi:sialate O-acetylesterase
MARIPTRFRALLLTTMGSLALSPFLEASQKLRVANLFGDHMVLQREKPIRIWGWGAPGEQIRVGFAMGTSSERTGTMQTTQDGQWDITLEALPSASFVGRDLVVESGESVRRFTDILVGDVWVCGGQSNMEWTLRSSRDADLEVESADMPEVRYLRLPKIAHLEPQADFPVRAEENGGPWRRCIPEEAADCTGVGYYFARRMRRRLDVPIGLIDVSWGGTMAQHWVTQETLRGFPEMQGYFDEFEARLSAWRGGGGEEGAAARYAEDLAAFETARAAAVAAGEREPRRPDKRQYEDPAAQGQPGGMLNGVIRPIARTSVRGVLFYQGENNSFGESWKPFHRTFPAVISDWRALFGEPQLPVGIIQIAGWSNRRTMTYDMNHHTNIVRELQHITWQRTANTGLIVTYDTNSNGSIHPGRKLPVGERAARWALSEVHGIKRYRSDEPLEWRGPLYESMQVEANQITIRFAPGTANGLRLDQDEEAGFYVAGADKEFHHARVRVQGGDNTLVIWSAEVPDPVAVRYGWSNLPAGGLMNSRELPAFPFRTDSWPLTPHQSAGSYQIPGD